MSSLSENIWVGFHHHFSISEIPKGKKYVPWHTIGIDVVAWWPLDAETWVIIDFWKLKGIIRSLLDDEFDHATLLSPRSTELLAEFRRRSMRWVETHGGSINGLPIVLFDRLIRANLWNSAVHLDNIRMTTDTAWWHIKNKDGSPDIKQLISPHDSSNWTSDLKFSHRIKNLWKCDWLHGHNWSPKITFSRALKKREYARITERIKRKLDQAWKGKAVLQSSDDFADFLLKNWRRVEKVNFVPTTEMLAISMIREIEKILSEDSEWITLAHFELWETPTNFVTTI